MARILLVEDDEDTRVTLVATIEAALGLATDAAEDGVEAVSKLHIADPPYDLVVTDERMPRMSGRELVRRIRHEYPRTRVVLMSAYHDGGAIAREVGADLFLAKPFDLPALLRSLPPLLRDAGPAPPSRPR